MLTKELLIQNYNEKGLTIVSGLDTFKSVRKSEITYRCKKEGHQWTSLARYVVYGKGCRQCNYESKSRFKKEDLINIKPLYKKCHNCELEKTKTEFRRNKSKKDGVDDQCKRCQREKDRLRRQLEPNFLSNELKRTRNYAIKHPFRIMLSRCKRNHKMKGFLEEFTLTEEYLKEIYEKQHGKCYWLNINLNLEEIVVTSLTAPSIDRLDCNIGYVKNNIVISSKFANLGRGNVPQECFREFIDKLLNNEIT